MGPREVLGLTLPRPARVSVLTVPPGPWSKLLCVAAQSIGGISLGSWTLRSIVEPGKNLKAPCCYGVVITDLYSISLA